MIQNQMFEYREERMSYLMAQDVAAYYAPRRYRPAKPVDKPCIVPVNKILGGRFDERG